MNVLTFTHADGNVSINIATRSIEHSLRRLKNRVGEQEAMHYCDYRTSAMGTLCLTGVSSLAEGCEWKQLPPVLFETCEYNVTIHFQHTEGQPHIIHANRDLAESFLWYPADGGGYLMASLNFLNEPGIFRLQYAYRQEGQAEQTGWIEFRVVSPKLDTKRDLMHMMRMINAEYENLVFKYLTKTFQTFRLSDSKSNNLIWLSIFKGIVGEYLTAIEYITNKPNMRGERQTYYDKIDHIKRWTPQMCNRMVEEQAKGTLDHYTFRHEETHKTIDTKENRFVKYTVMQTGIKLQAVISQLRTNYQSQLLGDELQWLDDKTAQLDKILHNRIWRQIGEFKGFRQESSVLQKRTGYAQVYRLWYILQSGLGFFEGSNEIGVRPIWELYELWCFLKMKQLIQECLDIHVEYPTHQSLIAEDTQTMLTPFSDSKVEHKVRYTNRFNGDEVELCYQHTYNRRSGEIHTATTEQRPDIVLNIRKADGFMLTYLYDAKYRVLDDKNKDIVNLETDYDIADYPPPDAINQMHRYRDAIYYGNKEQYDHAAKEIIGGYILFPGRYRKEHGGATPYYIMAAKEVNIGAFPLLPDADHPEEEGAWLREHLQNILRKQTKYEQIQDSIPQRGLYYTKKVMTEKNVYVGYVKADNPQIGLFRENKATLYYTGHLDFNELDIQSLEYLLPVVVGKVQGVYEIESVGFKKLSKIRTLRAGEKDEKKNELRVVFTLGEFVPFLDEAVESQKRFHNHDVLSMEAAKEAMRHTFR